MVTVWLIGWVGNVFGLNHLAVGTARPFHLIAHFYYSHTSQGSLGTIFRIQDKPLMNPASCLESLFNPDLDQVLENPAVGQSLDLPLSGTQILRECKWLSYAVNVLYLKLITYLPSLSINIIFQFCCSSVANSCPTLCDPKDCSISGFLSFTIS